MLRVEHATGSVNLAAMKATRGAPVTRFSISLPAALAARSECMTEKKRYDNRTLAVPNMIRARLVQHQQTPSKQGAVSRTSGLDLPA